ncbi:MAG: branched-chain amino acid ABC transporter permease [Saezia sp.]
MSIETLLISLLNGLSYALLLFLLSSGLTLIFGMMRVLNLAHGSFYMLGAYLGYTATCLLRVGFGWALIFVPCALGGLGFLTHHYVIKRVQGQGHLSELLLTYGVALVILALVQLVWGKSAVPYTLPESLQGRAFEWLGVQFPRYRLAVMLVAMLVLAGMAYFLRLRSSGVLLKAATQNPMMLEALGCNVALLMSQVFALGCALAGLAGVLGGVAYVTEPMMGQSMGMLLFVVIVIGGLGSLRGAFLASILIGIFYSMMVGWNVRLADLLHLKDIPLNSFWSMSTAQLAPLIPFILMVLVLWLCPQGLFGSKVRLR